MSTLKPYNNRNLPLQTFTSTAFLNRLFILICSLSMASLSTCLYFNVTFQSHCQRSSSSLDSIQILSIRYHPLYPLRPLTTLPTSSPPFNFPLLVCSSTQTQTPLVTTTELLLEEESKLSPSQVRTALRKAESIHTTQNAAQLLRGSGFTEKQVRMTILRNPSLLELKVDGQLNPKIEFLKEELGLTGKDLGHVISRESSVLSFNFENNLIPRISCLVNLFGSKANLSRALKMAPRLLICDVEKELKPKLELLQKYGCQGELLFHLLQVAPNILSSNSVESLKLKIQDVKNMGILEGSKTFSYALKIVTCVNRESLEKKLDLIASFGLRRDQIHEMLKKVPVVLYLSTDKIQKNMDFLTHTARLSPNVVVTYPVLLGFSVEKRLKPRYEAIKVLSESQGRKRLNLPSMLNSSEQLFLEKIRRFKGKNIVDS